MPSHESALRRYSLIARLSTLALLFASAHLLPLFDASPLLVPLSPLARPFLRWDVFHYLHIAQHNYAFLHERAFFPALPALMRLSSVFPLSPPSAALLGPALSLFLCDPTITLYRLSLLHLRDPNKAYLAALLSLIPPSPAALLAVPSSEPFFTYLSYKAMLYAAKSQWLPAAVCFALAGLFRSTAIFLAIFILWGLVVQPFLLHKSLSLIKATVLTAIVLAPFVYHNLAAYLTFCISSHPHSWCNNPIPSVYTHVQKAYWNVGLFNYWSISQIPNFIIAAPPLLLLFAFSIHYIIRSLLPYLHAFYLSSPPKSPTSSFLSPSVAPHAIHALFSACLFLFASHTQVVLRQAPAMPILYWAFAWLFYHHPSLARTYLSWALLWAPISVILWAAFLPPA